MPDRTEWKSPITDVVMTEIDVEGITVHHDPQSGGYWFENGELQQLADHHHREMGGMQVGEYMSAHRGRFCPQDGEQLLEFEFDGHSSIKLDICPHCRGVWLDAGELEGLIAYLEAADFTAEIPEVKHSEHASLSSRLLLFLYKITDHPPLF